MKRKMYEKVGIYLMVFALLTCSLTNYIGSTYEYKVNAYAQEYIYYATLDISSAGYSSYNTGLNYDLLHGTAGTIYQGAKLSVISEKINKKGNKVAYVYSEDLQKNCYVSVKYLKKVEVTETVTSSAGKDITCNKSVSLTELTNFANTLYECERYENAGALSGTATNITIKSVYNSIKSLVEFLDLVNTENVEVNTFVAGYNNDITELAKYEKFFESMKNYLILQKEYLTEYRDALCKAPYWMRYLNISNVVDVTNDCNELISCIDNVLNENLYSVQVEAGKKAEIQVAANEAAKVIAVANKDYGNNPRYIYSGKPYNGTSYGRSWCADWVQFILENSGKDYFGGKLCGTVDNIAIAVSTYGGTLYVTCDSKYKYGNALTRTSLKNDTYYANKISMNFDYGENMMVLPGDVIIYGCEPTYRFAHVGLCVEVYEDGSFKTIEGNTSWANYKNQCLNEKKRSLDWSAKNYSTGEVSYIMGVLRPDYSGTINASDVK